MNILICGGSGLLGRELSNLLLKKDINHYLTFNNNPVKNGIKINFLDLNDLQENFEKLDIGICVNCIVERQLETCENNWEYTKKTNIDISNNIAKICKIKNVYLIHISTDYVFDGKNAPYYPEDLTNPLQNYGISKLMSEFKVKSNCDKYAIIRVPVLYTDNIKNFQETAVTLIGKKVLNRIEIFKEDNFSIRRPNYIPDFCNFLYDLIKENKTGIFHFCNPYDKITKYEMSLIISNYLGKSNNIIPINEEPKDGADRPKDTFLKDNKYDVSKYNFTNIEDGLKKCFSKLYHPKLLAVSLELKDIFLMIDLDGTLIDSDDFHYHGYKNTLKKLYDFDFDKKFFYELIHENNIDNFLEQKFGIENKKIIKEHKIKEMKLYDKIDLIPNADKLINFIQEYNINHVIVTNTSKPSLDILIEKQPILSKLKNWITRENYNLPKPNKDSYETAKKQFYANEKYIIGIENTYAGYLSIKEITSCVYIVTDKTKLDYKKIEKEDVFIINNFKELILA